MTVKVERVDQPEPGLLCLTIREQRTNRALLISMLPDALATGIVDARPRGRTATESISQLRRHIEGSSLEQVSRSNRFVRVVFSRGGQRTTLVCAPRKPEGSWWLAGPDGVPIVRSAGAKPVDLQSEEPHLRPEDLTQLDAAGQDLLSTHLQARTRAIARRLDKQRRRLDKKRSAILEDLERADKANQLHEQATLILAYASQIPANADHFDAPTWDDQPRIVRLELDPKKTPPEIADGLFKKAKRMRRGLDIAPGRLEAVDRELASLSSLRTQLEAGSLDELTEALTAHGLDDAPISRGVPRRRKAEARSPYREFTGHLGASIFVGRNAADNDRLTLRVARPHDLWLHARGVTGAHVVVPLDKGKSCAAEILVDAATLAAHFSDLRGEPLVEVLYTPRRFVHKRKGAPVGAVSLGREKVIAVRLEDTRLRRLLDAERRT
ncbi:MAG: NFACT RNA binding domain-containing protein [Myxococcota bacterium]